MSDFVEVKTAELVGPTQGLRLVEAPVKNEENYHAKKSVLYR